MLTMKGILLRVQLKWNERLSPKILEITSVNGISLSQDSTILSMDELPNDQTLSIPTYFLPFICNLGFPTEIAL